jgi:hypothetical protein
MLADGVIGFVAYMLRDKLTGHMAEDWQDICDFSLGLSYGFIPHLTMFQVLTPLQNMIKENVQLADLIKENVRLADLDNGPIILQGQEPVISHQGLRLTVSYILSYVAFIAGATIGFRFFPLDKGGNE